ncbi:MAG: TrkA C-terminal domain-containing protein [Planctomycetaceae bacterium]|nr:hypothetical protein [Planctomycetaceae bacterium]
MSACLTLAGWSITAETTAFLVLLVGLLLGRLTLLGFQLGAAGIIFAGLLAGHLGLTLPTGVGTVGMVLFVYCLGIGAGPGFFQTLGRHGGALALLGIVMISSAAFATWVFARLSGIPADLATGLFAGALTSTPALATVSDFLPPDSQLTVGFGISYPLGTLLVILFVQLYTLYSKDASPVVAEGADSETAEGASRITRYVVEVLNPALSGKQLHDLRLLEETSCQVLRVLVDEKYRPIPPNFSLHVGQHLLIIGLEQDLRAIIDLFGKFSDRQIDVDVEEDLHTRRRVVITSPEMIGKSLKELRLRSRMGVTISRIRRHDVEFVPDSHEKFHRGDAVTAIGEPESLNKFMIEAGHRERTYFETDLLSLSAGILLGLILGSIEFRLGSDGFSLGKAGGPLIVGLLLGHWGRLGPLTGHFPAAARLLLTELGLALFLADSAVRAGRDFVAVLNQYGPLLLLGGLLITLLPLLMGLLVGRQVLKLTRQPLLGGICGAMTSTPGLGALLAADDANTAVRSYASIYPLALMLMSLLTPLLLSLLVS